ncbi:hypothetical protein Z3_202 [Bacillus phage Z3]|uniref:Uncharacterized protein n=1 Tax=Bacillus phage BM15 TaxID=1755680 RepID=A0A0S2MUF9_9CAUD|nr:hypothetical protein FD732_gp266 [Bacillus phage BM15]ALO79483.1 hypothetical protein BM10_72 [Bacillus phage BM15]WQZ49518.1 hypothetical protein Z3_202 [Bacillus phage Z3]
MTGFEPANERSTVVRVKPLHHTLETKSNKWSR